MVRVSSAMLRSNFDVVAVIGFLELGDALARGVVTVDARAPVVLRS